jgi:starch synthase
MRILFLSSEVVPFAKTGGLADVAGALPVALEHYGHEIRIVMPKYRQVKVEGETAVLGRDIKVRFIVNDRLYGRAGIYLDPDGVDYPDNLDRFSYYCRQALEYVKKEGFRPDIIHCNDWQTALVPVYLKTLYKDDDFFKGVKTVFTIHNLAYTGSFNADEWGKTALDRSLFNINGLEYYGRFSLLKGGLVFSDIITTVSLTYAKEIQTEEFGCGMEGVLRKRSKDLYGVLNGIDYNLWDPQIDRHIYKNYSYHNIKEKYVNKEMLLKELGMKVDLDMPLIGTVGRLAYQKGYDILADIVSELCDMNVGFVLLGAGEQRYHRILSDVAKRHKNNVSINLTYDAVLAQKIYAGCDIFLMPSRYEPCGLGQLISLKYSTIPVVRKTGGLADTVFEYDPETETGNGFLFRDCVPGHLLDAINKAVSLYGDEQRRLRLIRNIAQYDFSWDKSAGDYEKIYAHAISNPPIRPRTQDNRPDRA